MNVKPIKSDKDYRNALERLELIFDAPKAELDEVKILIKEKMEDAIKLSVPVIAEVGVGNNWLEAH